VNGFSRDFRGVEHHGTGAMELTILNLDDMEKTKPLIQKRYKEK
jgi:predicted transport protein